MAKSLSSLLGGSAGGSSSTDGSGAGGGAISLKAAEYNQRIFWYRQMEETEVTLRLQELVVRSMKPPDL